MQVQSVEHIWDHHLSRDRMRIVRTQEDDQGRQSKSVEYYYWVTYNRQGQLEELRPPQVDVKA